VKKVINRCEQKRKYFYHIGYRKYDSWKRCQVNINIKCMFLLISNSSQLFPDVVNCMQTDNLELKKLVYLYLMNYAKTQPEMAILAVNTFAKVDKKNKI